MAKSLSNKKTLIENIKTGERIWFTGNIRGKPTGWRVVK